MYTIPLSGIDQITIYNLLGKIVTHIKTDGSDEITIPLADFTSGIYMVEARMGNVNRCEMLVVQ